MNMNGHVASICSSIRERRALSRRDCAALRDALENHRRIVVDNQQSADLITSILALDYAGLIGKEEERV